jgi:hypothetical protein
MNTHSRGACGYGQNPIAIELQFSCCCPIRPSVHPPAHPPTHGPTALCCALTAFSVSSPFTQTVGLLGRRICPSQGRFLHTRHQKHIINAHGHPCLKWDSNPRSQCLSGRRHLTFPSPIFRSSLFLFLLQAFQPRPMRQSQRVGRFRDIRDLKYEEMHSFPATFLLLRMICSALISLRKVTDLVSWPSDRHGLHRQHVLINRHRYEHRKRLTRKYVTCTCSLRPEVKHLFAYRCYFACYSQSQTLQFLESYNIVSPTLSEGKICHLTWTRVLFSNYILHRDAGNYTVLDTERVELQISSRNDIIGFRAYFQSGYSVRDGLVGKIIRSRITGA